MKEHPTRNDALRSLSAIGAGVLLAATPHCGGKSEGPADEPNESGGASGSAGTTGGNGGVGQPGSGGAYGGNFGPGTSGYGGSYGGSFGGSVGSGGSCPIGNISRCWSPQELLGCAGAVDAGADVITVDSGSDAGTGEGGAAGAAGEAPPEPELPDPGSGAVPPPPDGFTCPSIQVNPQCVMSDNPPPGGFPSSMGWNGTQCCYTFLTCY